MERIMNLILMAIGDDRPGLVGQLSAAIGRHGGNWLQSSMSHFAGKFAGIVRVDIGEERVDALEAELAALPGLRVTAEVSGAAPASSGRRLNLALAGHDRIGIVREVSHVLARHAVNVEELSTHTASAPMSAEILFHATAELTASPSLDTRALVRDLEQISNDLMVDITLDESIR
ncbi:MAG: glycine cleavage system protein R [Candidatus Accumulibacter sp.]|jgi:glycine cleavage system regulatory protein|nr:glycine cleavage system protein R [Accumulibacter sp.]